ncbi:MAG: hypothetical protein KJZ93_00725 [Caldilineaceae bacterium]|nr:hypothetical protein [Caldilineaceae bacterium]
MSSPHARFAQQSYLLRCWPTAPVTRKKAHRFMLIHLQTGVRRGFTDLELLIAFLREQVERTLDDKSSGEP